MINALIMVGIVIFLTPSIVYWLVFLWAIMVCVYYATQATWFKIRVLYDMRKQPENYPYLDNIYMYPYLIFLEWWSRFLNGINFIHVEAVASKTRYYFNGWSKPKKEIS